MSRLQILRMMRDNNEYIVVVEATGGAGDREVDSNTDAYRDSD